MKCKKLLSLALALVMTFALAAPSLAAEENVTTGSADVTYTVPADASGAVVILHSNDVHGAVEGYAKMAALKAMYQAAGAEVYVMDAGDFSQGTTYVSVSQGATAVELMNMVGYVCAAPGNHEFDYGYENLKALQEEATFPILAGNLTYNGEFLLGHSDRLVLETGAGKIGVFGLDTPETASKAHPAKIAGVTFSGGEVMYVLAESYVTALKDDGADIIVCLGHLGIDDESAAGGNRSIDLLEKVSGIDVFIDGHSHSTEADLVEKTNADRTVNGTVITSTGTKFANIGVVTIKDGKITTDCVPADQIPVPENDPIAARAAEIVSEIEASYGAPFAKSEVELNGAKAPNGNRDSETNNGDLITDAMLWYATKEPLDVPTENVVAITNGGGIRAAVKVGDVSKNDINTVLPFGNTVAVDYVSGAVLLEVLEASTFCTPEAVGGFPQVAGINFTLDTTKAFDQGPIYGSTTYHAPASINRVTINSINGKPFDPNATYGVVTNDFVAAGGDTYYALSVSERITDTGTPLDEAVMAYITEVLGGTIPTKYAAPQGRITIIGPYPQDLKETDWWYDAATQCIDTGALKGTNVGFEPEKTLTAAEIYQTLFNLVGKPEIDGFEVKEGDPWYTAAMNWAFAAGIYIEELEDFENHDAPRSEVRDILSIYLAVFGEGSANDLFIGNGEGEMMWEKTITRAEWATLLVRMSATPAPQAN